MRSCVWDGHYDTVTLCNTWNCTLRCRIKILQYELHYKILFKSVFIKFPYYVSFSLFDLLLLSSFTLNQQQPTVHVLFILQNCYSTAADAPNYLSLSNLLAIFLLLYRLFFTFSVTETSRTVPCL